MGSGAPFTIHHHSSEVATWDRYNSSKFPWYIYIYTLVGGWPTPLKNMSQWEGLSHILWKIKNVWNHQPVYMYIYIYVCVCVSVNYIHLYLILPAINLHLSIWDLPEPFTKISMYIPMGKPIIYTPIKCQWNSLSSIIIILNTVKKQKNIGNIELPIAPICSNVGFFATGHINRSNTLW